jgi:hypothetical protein
VCVVVVSGWLLCWRPGVVGGSVRCWVLRERAAFSGCGCFPVGVLCVLVRVLVGVGLVRVCGVRVRGGGCAWGWLVALWWCGCVCHTGLCCWRVLVVWLLVVGVLGCCGVFVNWIVGASI